MEAGWGGSCGGVERPTTSATNIEQPAEARQAAPTTAASRASRTHNLSSTTSGHPWRCSLAILTHPHLSFYSSAERCPSFASAESLHKPIARLVAREIVLPPRAQYSCLPRRPLRPLSHACCPSPPASPASDTPSLSTVAQPPIARPCPTLACEDYAAIAPPKTPPTLPTCADVHQELEGLV
jgi:hypothetical protein